MARLIYADNAATTALSPHALEAMMPFLTTRYGNPSSAYSFAQDAKSALEEARAKAAAVIGAKPAEIYFTGGGTEADNWAVKSVARLLKDKGRHIISSAVEHHAVLHSLEYLEKEGYEVTYLGVDQYGRISIDELRAAIRPDTILITIMAANNEIGTLMPVAEIGKIAKEHKILFHTDAVQAVGHIPIDVKAMNVDLLSLAAHKFRGPKGIGALYIRQGLRLPPHLHGGAQERNFRAGTENVAGIIGLAAALEDASTHMAEHMEKVSSLRDKLIHDLLATIPYSRLTGDPENRLPGIASFVFECVEGESLILLLDENGICGSSGSACSSSSLDPSHVLMAIGLPHEIAHGSLRLSLNEENTEADVDYIVKTLPAIIAQLREMSPLWEGKPVYF